MNIYPPCHHPDWPRKCPNCEEPCNGTAANVVTRGERGPLDFGAPLRVGEMAYQFTASHCEKCKLITVLVPSWLSEAEEWKLRLAFKNSCYFENGTVIRFTQNKESLEAMPVPA